MLFAGFFVAPHLIPSWLQWVPYVCSLTYAIRILLVEEFQDCGDVYPEGVQRVRANVSCNMLIDNLNADEDDSWWYWLVLVVLFVVLRLSALAILRKKAVKFL
jgi:hypothetical protein